MESVGASDELCRLAILSGEGLGKHSLKAKATWKQYFMYSMLGILKRSRFWHAERLSQ